ncbi:ankyrin repeat-containing domain protein, partial [Geopyxis carbonaria]
QNTDGATPLYYAASRGRQEEAALLIDYGAKTELKDSEGWTALHCAAVKGFEPVVSVLMGKGRMNGDLPDLAQLTPLHYAAFRGHHGTVRLLLKHGVN